MDKLFRVSIFTIINRLVSFASRSHHPIGEVDDNNINKTIITIKKKQKWFDQSHQSSLLID
jgi:hypothetical protein